MCIRDRRALDGTDRPLGLARGHAELGQPPHRGPEVRRRRKRVEPRVVLASHEMQRAAVQPGHDQRALGGQRPVDVGGGEAARAGPDREAKAAWVLALDRQQALRDRARVGGRRARQPLRGEALADQGTSFSIRYLRVPCGASTSTTSPGERPSSAVATGDSSDSLP